MIKLDYTKAQMLQDLHAPAALPELSDPFTDAFANYDTVRSLVKGITPDDLLPGLNAAFSRRYPDYPPEDLQRDLLNPLKKAVGNAHKRGNTKDPNKQITVEIVATAKGSLIEISDEGEGFDVRDTYEKFRNKDEYFEHSGSGFRKYKKAASVVTFANGGSTVLICFNPQAKTSDSK